MATPFVQGRLRDEAISFDITTECACCGRKIHITVNHDLNYRVKEAATDPLFFVPMVDFTRLKDPSIIDAF